MAPSSEFWRGKRVLLTGHSGFKGGWLALWLAQLGAKVTGVALPPNTSPSLFELTRLADQIDSRFCNIRDAAALVALVRATRPEIVLHLAAQPLVRASFSAPLDTFASNVMGTANLLDALRDLSGVRVAVMVTTDKVYHNLEHPYPYREGDTLGGLDPYSASKAAAEIVIASYRDAFLSGQGVALASARAGNVIGGGDWSADRLIPDAVRAWQSGCRLEIRRPQAIRPWQHVLEPLAGYLCLVERLWEQPELAGAYNFGPPSHEAATVREVVEMARAVYGSGEVGFGDGGGPHEAGCLALETAKARAVLGFSTQWTLAESIRRTMGWYRAQYDREDARQLCLTEINDYVGGASQPKDH